MSLFFRSWSRSTWKQNVECCFFCCKYNQEMKSSRCHLYFDLLLRQLLLLLCLPAFASLLLSSLPLLLLPLTFFFELSSPPLLSFFLSYPLGEGQNNLPHSSGSNSEFFPYEKIAYVVFLYSHQPVSLFSCSWCIPTVALFFWLKTDNGQVNTLQPGARYWKSKELMKIEYHHSVSLIRGLAYLWAPWSWLLSPPAESLGWPWTSPHRRSSSPGSACIPGLGEWHIQERAFINSIVISPRWITGSNLSSQWCPKYTAHNDCTKENYTIKQLKATADCGEMAGYLKYIVRRATTRQSNNEGIKDLQQWLYLVTDALASHISAKEDHPTLLYRTQWWLTITGDKAEGEIICRIWGIGNR